MAGNEALHKNWLTHDGRVLGVFCFDKAFLSRSDFSHNRFGFFIETLISLQSELREMGGDLLFLDEGPEVAFESLIKDIEVKNKIKPNLITWCRDYEPYSIKRDQRMEDYFSSQSIPTKNFRDHLLIEPNELIKNGKEQGWYQVFTPFSRQWLRLMEDEQIKKRLTRQEPGLKYLKNWQADKTKRLFKMKWSEVLSQSKRSLKTLEHYRNENQKKVKIKIPAAGSLSAFAALCDYEKKVSDYSQMRDFPFLTGTSGFSIYLKNGSLTVPQIIAYYKLQAYTKKTTSSDVFLSELIWREFYYHILFHKPEVETTTFLAQYQDLPWQNNEKWFAAWKDGLTGYPIVDAGMRQLKETGWMHNRVRMIVASFLTKHLHISWQWGEKYFMEVLLDGDLAPNNGGWQWAASTGCDPQPYFRIFNPWSQSLKFDPNGDYIKKYVPELKNIPPAELHEPLNVKGYPKPIVDHKTQREETLKMFKRMRE